MSLRPGSIVATCVLAVGCATSGTTTPPPEDNPVPEIPDDTTAVLEIYTLDLWGQPLEGNAALTIISDGAVVEPLGEAGILYVPLADSGVYDVTLAQDGYDTVQVSVSFDGTDRLEAVHVLGGDGKSGVAASHEMRDLDERGALPIHSVYLGLRHQWFSAEGRPARRGNDLAFLPDGEEAWGAVADDMAQANDRIELASWWFESDFELVRDWDGAENPANSILARLEASPATKRVLIGQFLSQDGILSNVTTDAPLRAHGAATGDDFEFMGQANPTSGQFEFAIPGFEFGDRVRAARGETADRAFDDEVTIESTVAPRDVDLTQWPVSVDINHASWHQKLAVLDEIAYVGGMNAKATDWDTSEHLIDDPRRQGQGPRKDYMVRIDGPSAQDVEDVFARRWEMAREDGVDYSENTTAFEVRRDQVAHPGGVQAQITTTMPEPLWEHSIVETWLNAVAHASDYIFIEDQYFRAPILTEAILARMAAVPALKLVVITKPINEWTDPGCAWTYRTAAQLEAALGDRFMLLQLRAFATEETWGWDETESRYADIDVHSKILIVDDVFMSVGSANKNNRGLVYEGEMSIAVHDRAWVTDARRRIIDNLLGFTGADVSDDWWTELGNEAAWNDWVAANWDAEGGDISLDGAPLPDAYSPVGFVYSLSFPDVSECLFESVGPDQT